MDKGMIGESEEAIPVPSLPPGGGEGVKTGGSCDYACDYAHRPTCDYACDYACAYASAPSGTIGLKTLILAG